LSALLPRANASDLSGKVTNAQGGETLGKVKVSLASTTLAATTGPDGSFRIVAVPAGKYVLQFNAVGYRTLSVPVEIAKPDQNQEFTVNLVPDLQARETVEVRGDIYQAPDWPAVGDMTLTSSELQQTATVLANDPLRALGGCAANHGSCFRLAHPGRGPVAARIDPDWKSPVKAPVS